VRILGEVDDLEQVRINPSVFIDQVVRAMNEALYTVASDGGIEYALTGEGWSIKQFKDAHQTETVVKREFVVTATKSVTDKIVCDSKVEVDFARELERRDDILLYLKLPGWYKISTPLGNYNPDWAFIRRLPDGELWSMVGETKGTDKIVNLQWESEGWKIKFGRAHFEALGVLYDFGYDLIGMILRANEKNPRSI
jgi:type III restriction enzyme